MMSLRECSFFGQISELCRVAPPVVSQKKEYGHLCADQAGIGQSVGLGISAPVEAKISDWANFRRLN
jgi:hypothetical protein